MFFFSDRKQPFFVILNFFFGTGNSMENLDLDVTLLA